ncbi:MAG: glutaredoxin [Burkholderiales bacterium]|nr:glutaredoxin [Burkholderiales bacterium]
MPRSILPEDRIHPAIRDTVAGLHADVVREVAAAVAADDIVIVGMAINPFPRRARRLLDAAGIAYRYLEYGSYAGQWRRRNALKMWTGWPTFPMVFVRGVLVGGAAELARLHRAGELARLLAAPRPDAAASAA